MKKGDRVRVIISPLREYDSKEFLSMDGKEGMVVKTKDSLAYVQFNRIFRWFYKENLIVVKEAGKMSQIKEELVKIEKSRDASVQKLEKRIKDKVRKVVKYDVDGIEFDSEEEATQSVARDELIKVADKFMNTQISYELVNYLIKNRREVEFLLKVADKGEV